MTPTASRRVALADDDRDTREFLTESLARQGWSVTAGVDTGRALVEACRKAPPDLVVTDIRMPDMDGMDAAVAINNDRPTPVVIVSAHHDDALMARIADVPVLGYLVKPFTEAQLKSAVAVAVTRSKELGTLRQEASDLRQALADRKVIERAKGILMQRLGVDEDEAFRRLRSGASAHNLKMVETARRLIAAEEVLCEFGGRLGGGS